MVGASRIAFRICAIFLRAIETIVTAILAAIAIQSESIAAAGGVCATSNVRASIPADSGRVYSLAMSLNADLIAGKRLCVVEVEDEDEARALKDDHFVALMLPRDVGLREKRRSHHALHGGHEALTYRPSTQECMSLLELVHCAIERIHKLVAQILGVDEVPLSTTIVIGLVVADARKIKPL